MKSPPGRRPGRPKKRPGRFHLGEPNARPSSGLRTNFARLDLPPQHGADGTRNVSSATDVEVGNAPRNGLAECPLRVVSRPSLTAGKRTIRGSAEGGKRILLSLIH